MMVLCSSQSGTHSYCNFTGHSKGGNPYSGSGSLRSIIQRITGSGVCRRIHPGEIDDRDLRGGEKYWSWVKKGIPLTIEIGPRDLENGTVFVGRRDHGSKREGMERQALVDGVTNILEEIQSNLFARALAFREENTVTIDSKEELYAYFTPQNKSKPEMHGGFALVHWDRDPQWEEQLKNDLKVTVRCIPEDSGEPWHLYLFR